MLAKLSSGLHKPDDQTVLRPCQAADFVAPLPLRAIPGVGYKLGRGGIQSSFVPVQCVHSLQNRYKLARPLPEASSSTSVITGRHASCVQEEILQSSSHIGPSDFVWICFGVLELLSPLFLNC